MTSTNTDEGFDPAALLEEVFSEVESLEKSTSSTTIEKKTGFLEDLLNLDEEIAFGNKKLDDKRKKSVKKTEDSDSIKNLDVLSSIIHEGLTDSSDDEDNKYFEETKYNDCGKNLKNLIKQKTSAKSNQIYLEKDVSKVEDTWTNSQSAREKLKQQLEKIKDIQRNTSSKSDLLVDPVLGMRIIKPLVSSAALKDKMIGRISVGTSKLKQFIESPSAKDSDWVTGGAIVSKLTKTSQKGNQYCLWHITDLTGDIKTVCVFLFGSAYKEYWKTSVGAVVGILNPVVMDSNEKSEATLRVDNAQKILLMGTSKDYGLCKSKKKNGENCLSVVNTAKCDFCTYHMKKEYNIACRRSDLQPPKIGRKLDNLRAKVLGKSQVFYGGKTFTGVVGKKSSKQLEKDEKRLKSLSEKNPGPLNELRKQKDQDIMSRLSNNLEPLSTKVKTPSPCQPQMIDLDFTISKKDRSAAKANALKYIREHGPLKKLAEDVKKKKTPEQISSIKRKLEVEEENESKKMKTDDPEKPASDPLKEKKLKNGITEEFLKLMNSGARNQDLVKVAENEEREKYFNKLEIREKIEDKMSSTFKVECKAVRCLKCNYKSFSASDLCKKEKHPLKVVNAIKRFWKCGNCSGRTVCLELVPLHSCKTCGSSKWERASMMPEKKGPNLTVEPLSLRGLEEKFIGATIKNASLNLLVPEEVS